MKKLITLALFVIAGCAGGSKELTPRQKAGLHVVRTTDQFLNDPHLAAVMLSQVKGATILQRGEILITEGGEGGVVIFYIKNDEKKVLANVLYFVLCEKEIDTTTMVENYLCEPVTGKIVEVK